MSLPPSPRWVEPVETPVQTPASSRPPGRIWVNLLLAAATVFTTVLTGGVYSTLGARAVTLMLSGGPSGLVWGGALFLLAGLPYAAAVMTFFLAHEMGHYLACRHHGVDATLPYFIPAPPPIPPIPTLFGTMGAVIRIRGPIPSRRVLFDIGIAGPLAGFVVAVPILAAGILHASVVGPRPAGLAGISFGDSLLTHFLTVWLRPEARHMELAAGPIFIAGWLGVLATAMNLIPAGQLDGGHIVYALDRRWHRAIGLASAGFLCALVATRFIRFGQFSAWVLWAFVVLWIGRRHPPLPRYEASLGWGRKLLAVAAAIILLLAFMPHPVELLR